MVTLQHLKERRTVTVWEQYYTRSPITVHVEPATKQVCTSVHVGTTRLLSGPCPLSCSWFKDGYVRQPSSGDNTQLRDVSLVAFNLHCAAICCVHVAVSEQQQLRWRVVLPKSEASFYEGGSVSSCPRWDSSSISWEQLVALAAVIMMSFWTIEGVKPVGEACD